MSNVIGFHVRDREFIVVYSRNCFLGRTDLPPFWIEIWDGHPDSESQVVWTGSSYADAMREARGMTEPGFELRDLTQSTEGAR